MRCLLLSLLALAFAPLAHAQAGAPSTWYNQVMVEYVYAGKVGNRVAFRVTTPISVGTCPTTANGGEFGLDRTNPHFDLLFIMLMTAYTKAKPISVFTDGTCSAYGVTATDLRLP